MASGEEKRVAVTEYSGLIGASLDLAAKVFPGYEPVKTEELESPVIGESLRQLQNGETDSAASGPDNLTQVYRNYIEENDPDADNVFGLSDNCPVISNPDQLDSDSDGIGDICETEEAAAGEEEEAGAPDEGQTVEIIDLPAEEPAGEQAVEEGTTPTDEAIPADN